jgi:5-methylcytosine-specific restriction enzyme A
VECLKENRTTAATVVDHKTPHRGNQELFWDENGWQSLCTLHHNQKTASENK